jgi:hypothetical protein
LRLAIRLPHELATAWFTDVSWLWYNVIGCAVVVGVALGITYGAGGATSAMPDTQPQA